MNLNDDLEFESSVILDGNKTSFLDNDRFIRFESSVILDGNKTTTLIISRPLGV